MTESYGQFIDAVDDFMLPLSESNQQEVVIKDSPKKKNDTFLSRIFRALEKVNNAQFESTESLVSLASRSSFESLTDDERQGVSLATVFDAFQKIAINESQSSNSLLDYDAAAPTESSSMAIPAVLQHLMSIFDDFMHNHSHLEEMVKRDSSAQLDH